MAFLPETSSKKSPLHTNVCEVNNEIVISERNAVYACKELLTPDLKYFKCVPLTILKVYSFHWCFLFLDSFSRRAVLLSSSGSRDWDRMFSGMSGNIMIYI